MEVLAEDIEEEMRTSLRSPISNSFFGDKKEMEA